jgi:tRNA(fMet)-specific endonuclease VapC
MSAAVILDTDVVSFLFKGDTRAEAYRIHLRGKTLALSFMTVAELYQWAFVRNWGADRITRLEQQLANYVIVPYDRELCWQWAKICAARQSLGKPISVPDAWIAATAVRHACPLVTHNKDDYTDVTGLIVITAGG